MSLLVFPLTFDNVGFPIKQTPYGNTIKQTPYTGRGEIRIPTMTFPRWLLTIDINCLRGDASGVNTPWQLLVNFFLATQFGADDWMFLHPYDNACGANAVTGGVTSGVFYPNENLVQATSGATSNLIGTVYGVGPMLIGPVIGTADGSHGWVGQKSGAIFTPSAVPAVNATQAIGQGDGTATAWSMIRTFIVGGAGDLIQNFVNPPAIFLNGALQSSSNYTIDEYGTITFTAAPGAGVIVSWLGQFYWRMHFFEDKWENLQEEFEQIWTLEGLKLESVLL